MKRRDFFRLAGWGAWLGCVGGTARAAVSSRTARPVRPSAEIPEIPFAAFPLREVATATAAFSRSHEATLAASSEGGALMVTVREAPAQPSRPGGGSLWLRRLGADGEPVGEARPLFAAGAENSALSSPALRRLPNQRLGMLYSHGGGAKESSRLFVTSGDEGLTWSHPVVVAEGSYRTGCHDRFTVHSSGRLLAPLQCSENWADHHFYASVARSDDGGRTWQSGSRIESLPVGGRLGCGWVESGCTAPGLAERADGTLLMTLRTALGTQFCSESHDRGETWKPARSLEVGSPLAPAHLSRLPGTDQLLLVWNLPRQAQSEASAGLHTIMAAVSPDGGRSWPWETRKVLLHHPDHAFDSPTVTYRDGEMWVTARRTEGLYSLQGPTSTWLMRVPLAWMGV